MDDQPSRLGDHGRYLAFRTMRIRLSTLFWVLTTAGLACALVLARNTDSEIKVRNYFESWRVSSSSAFTSEWPNKSSSPELSVQDAHQIGFELGKHLNSFNHVTGVDHWEVCAVSLERLTTLNDESWAYFVCLEGYDTPGRLGAGGNDFLTIMILMDGTTLFPAECYTANISEIIMKFPGLVDGSAHMGESSIHRFEAF